MTRNLTSLERAFELAKSGDFLSVADIRKQLKAEGYTLEQIIGRSLMKQLSDLIRTAQLSDNDHIDGQLDPRRTNTQGVE